MESSQEFSEIAMHKIKVYAFLSQTRENPT